MIHRASIVTLAAASLLLATLAFAPPAHAGDKRQAAARSFAQKMYAAFLKADYKTFSRYAYPRLVKKSGGKAKLIEQMKRGAVMMSKRGIHFRSVKIGKCAAIVRAGKELHTTLPLSSVIDTPKGRLLASSYLIGISSDKGKTWSFVDGIRINKGNVKKLFPNYNPRLVLPKPAPPKKL